MRGAPSCALAHNGIDMEPGPDDLLTPDEVAQYLANAWGRPFTGRDFLNLRTNMANRAKKMQVPPEKLFPISPVKKMKNNSLWRRGDIDLLIKTMAEQGIDPPEYQPIHRKPRAPRNLYTIKD